MILNGAFGGCQLSLLSDVNQSLVGWNHLALLELTHHLSSFASDSSHAACLGLVLVPQLVLLGTN